MEKKTQVSAYLTDEQMTVLEDVQRHFGLNSVDSTIRYALEGLQSQMLVDTDEWGL